MDFLSTIFNEDEKGGLHDYIKQAEQIINDMHIYFRGQFENYKTFKS